MGLTEEEWRLAAGYGALITCCLYGFYCVTELRFVPIIKKLCNRWRIPDDVAGATVLGAALNAPELFTSAISTLAMKENHVGVGVVMGSFNFNIFICTGMTAVLARTKLRSRQLRLEWLFLQRDVYFYAIALALIAAFCRDGVLEWWECLVFVLTYLVYVLACAFSGRLIARLFPKKEYKPRRKRDALVGLDIATGSYNFQLHAPPSGQAPSTPSVIDQTNSLNFSTADLDDQETARLLASDSKYRLRSPLDVESLKVQTAVGLERQHSLERMRGASGMGDASAAPPLSPVPESVRALSLLKQPLLEASSPMHSFRSNFQDPVARVLHFEEGQGGASLDEEDEKMLVHTISNPDDPGRIKVDLRLVSCAHDEHDRDEPWATDVLDLAERVVLDEECQEYRAQHLLAFPRRGNWRTKVGYVVLLPFHALVALTIPVGRESSMLSMFAGAFMSIAWLAGVSFALSLCSKGLGDALHIDDAVVGLVLDSVGTSLPNAIAAIMAGKSGKADTAICQAFGSNTFDALVAFGLPMMIKCFRGGFRPIQVEVHDVVGDSLIDLGMLVTYVGALFLFRMRLTRAFGAICLAMYTGWLGYELWILLK